MEDSERREYIRAGLLHYGQTMARRDRMVLDALNAGVSRREVAAAMRIGHATIERIVARSRRSEG